MQDEIWNQFGIQKYNGNVLSVYSVVPPQLNHSTFYIEVNLLTRERSEAEPLVLGDIVVGRIVPSGY